MGGKSITNNKTCPFCNNYVSYWPNCTAEVKYDAGWLINRAKVRQFFHISCLKQNSIKDVKTGE